MSRNSELEFPHRKSPAGFITLEVTAEVRINTKPKIRLLNVIKLGRRKNQGNKYVNICVDLACCSSANYFLFLEELYVYYSSCIIRLV